MGGVIDFGLFLIAAALNLIVWIVIGYVILSWLVAFHVINMRNNFARTVVVWFDAVSRPILRPIRRLVPPIGGALDISPFVVVVVIQGALIYLLPALGETLHRLVGQ